MQFGRHVYGYFIHQLLNIFFFTNCARQDKIGKTRLALFYANNGVFPKWSKTFIEFSEFTESDKSLKHKLGSV